ncbi:HD domain-containing protein [Neomegalonema sp.]|uniref:HD domain-containing protein n=1 Tax=Neomegalonema sp. TaxID=2039713 RepID=UPI002628FFF9|nr:HD domain-containing protein [Neomegalonema sp.]MDD2869812.1 HD domain-containing protein [Neomegalonema sp.]
MTTPADSDSFLNALPCGGPPATARADARLVLLTRAYDFAARAHVYQKRKGAHQGLDYPYLNHLCEVAALVAEVCADPDVIVAAILHDCVEDRHAALADVREAFGERTALLVDAMTDRPEWELLTTAERKRLQAESLASKPPEAKIIKMADQVSNLRARTRALDRWTPLRLRAYLTSCQVVARACEGASPHLDGLFRAAATELGAALDALPPLSAAETQALDKLGDGP